MESLTKKIRKKLIRLWVRFHERVFKIDNHEIRYVYLNNNSQKLCIGFAGFPELGGAATYNYIRTLKKYKEYNYLFVLDDM